MLEFSDVFENYGVQVSDLLTISLSNGKFWCNCMVRGEVCGFSFLYRFDWMNGDVFIVNCHMYSTYMYFMNEVRYSRCEVKFEILKKRILINWPISDFVAIRLYIIQMSFTFYIDTKRKLMIWIRLMMSWQDFISSWRIEKEAESQQSGLEVESLEEWFLILWNRYI